MNTVRGPEAGQEIVGTPSTDDLRRFWQKVELTPTCWLWRGATNQDGYGIFLIYGKAQRAHRVARHLLGLSLEPTKTCDHICSERRCVNPAHTEIVTQVENLYRKGRKQFCNHGHAMTPENTAVTYVAAGGYLSRGCISCFPHLWTKAEVQSEPPPGRETTRAKWKGPAQVPGEQAA